MKLSATWRVLRRTGSALVMTLAVIVLATVIALGYLAGVTLESQTARMALQEQNAGAMADLALNAAMARLRDGLGPWDNPYGNFCASNGSPPAFYWSVSPGRLTRWSYTNVAPLTNFALFSESPDTNLVNLNRRLEDGSYPIIGGSNAPEVAVKWVNVPENPVQAAGAGNPIVGRYAFWVDDEAAKININTADGTRKAHLAESLGSGTPTEVSLQVLSQGGTALPQEVAENIVQMARTNGFSSAREILRAGGTSPDLFTNNVFHLTVSSRSPDLNVFGQPRIPLIPGFRTASSSTNISTNGITLRPFQEIHPGYEQLPRLSGARVSINAAGNMVTNAFSGRIWPTVLQQMNAEASAYGNSGSQNEPWSNGWLLARFLSGTNASGQPVVWPAFPGSQCADFLGKYTARQVDSLAMQIMDLGAKATSPDQGAQGTGVTDVVSAPSVGWGWLSSMLVSGMGRSPKVSQILMEVSAQGSSGIWGEPAAPYTPPKFRANTYVEWWFHSAFSGNSVVHNEGQGELLRMGDNIAGMLNVQDAPYTTGQNQNLYSTGTNVVRASLPQPDGKPNFWSDSLLRNNQGIDFSGSPPQFPDPDQDRAAALHHPYAYSTNSSKYMGTGSGSGTTNVPFTPVLMMAPDEVAANSLVRTVWPPGQLRAIRNRYNGISYPMQTNASGNPLVFGGGIAVLSQLHAGRVTDPDPTPLEAVRGSEPAPTNAISRTGETFSAPARTPSSSETVRDRVAASVIPMAAVVNVPPHDDLSVNAAWIWAKATDPLVNKFPGDWTTTVSLVAPPTTMQIGGATTSKAATYSETPAMQGALEDPDSYWMPVIDSFYSKGESPLIPRSARFPSIGYLQYVRTGIIPDDESVSYPQQHGTPFRLLSFAPSTETTNQTTTRSGSLSYPDWALLDLLYIPSTLIPWGGPYGSSSNLVHYGTYGGATAGRINPNGSLIYTTNVLVPQTNVSRNIPMQAVLDRLSVNQSLAGAPTTSAGDFTTPNLSAGTAVDRVAIAKAVEDFIRTNGPLRMPAEICNIPAIAALRPSANPTRNDLVRQIVGVLTTQSNVFSVWVAGQAIRKNPRNTSYGQFEAGDSVLSEVRARYIVERYLDPGADGVYGNAENPGPDGVVGSLDDPVDATNNPTSPKYLYQVIFSERIQG